MLSKSAQVGRYGKKALRKVDAPESDLQQYTNEYLEWCHIKHVRVPDTMNATHLRNALAGIPDNLLLLPLTDKYSIVCALELKTKSKMRTSQKQFAREVPTQIAQTPDEVEQIVTAALRFVERLRKEI